MAVAVKNTSGSRSSGFFDRPAVVSLVGALYVLACLAIVFKLLPQVWGPAWEAVGLGKDKIAGSVLQGLVLLLALAGLLYLGVRLLGPRHAPGVRSGIFVGLLGLVLAVLLIRWASLWVEHYAFERDLLIPATGVIILAVLSVAVLLVGATLFTGQRSQRGMVWFEEGGWFSFTAYKPSQGQKVRRATILGILLLVGAGVYTLISHGSLRRGPADYVVDIPFTGSVAVDQVGDTGQWLAALEEREKDKLQVEVRRAGVATGLTAGEAVSAPTFRAKVQEVIAREDFPPEARAAIEEAMQKDTLTLLLEIDRQLRERMRRLLARRDFLKEGTVKKLREMDERTTLANVSVVVDEFVKDAEVARREAEAARAKPVVVGPIFDLPTAVLKVDRYQLREINQQTDESKNVKIELGRDSKFQAGQVVTRQEFNDEVARLQKEGRGRRPPEMEPLTPAGGPTTFEHLTLLPAVRFTVPLLLLVGALWLAWRVVNQPAFADFLIATEAELNKVSWTTQRRLAQDTVVVLVTVVLMGCFLFAMDQVWRVVLSWEPIGVLVIPKDKDADQTLENKGW